MFDTIYASLVCPLCEQQALQEIQTKAFDGALARYEVGDIITSAPAGDAWLKETWRCPNCINQWHNAWIHLVDGFVFEVVGSMPAPSQQVADTNELISALRRAALRGTELKLDVAALYSHIKNTQAQWEFTANPPITTQLPSKEYPTTPEKLLADVISRNEQMLSSPLKEPL